MIQNENVGSEQSEETANQDPVFVLKPEPHQPRAEPDRRAGEPTGEEDRTPSRAVTWRERAREYWWVGALAGGLAAATVTCLLVRRHRRQEPLARVRRFVS